MGSDKALLPVGGKHLIQRIADAARPLAVSITAVGRDAAIEGIASVPDRRPGLGPLAGLEVALEMATTPTVLVVACDLPFVSTGLLRLLLERSAAAPESAVVPVDGDGIVSPLCAVYPKSAAGLASELLDRGERTLRVLLMQIPTIVVPFADLAHLDNAGELLTNVNTPHELSAARSRLSDAEPEA